MKRSSLQAAFFITMIAVFYSCHEKSAVPSALLIKEMNLKRGDLVSCGPADAAFGSLAFEVTGTPEGKKNFLLALKLLHSFEYDEAEKVFADVIENDPGCAMAYWGVAMSNFHALWAPPTEAELKKGAKAVDIAQSITGVSPKEKAYIAAIAAYYNNYQKTDHRTRCLQFETAMANLTALYPGDKEAAIFYALALNAAADPADKTFTRQKKAGEILRSLYPGQTGHPGIVHYIIHTYDVPELATNGLVAARNYASVAPSSAHALHMPSHIFTRLGLWEECISSNRASVDAAVCYATSTGIKGHWDEELHGLDYLMYAYLQRGQNDLAESLLVYLDSIGTIDPANFKVAYSLAAMPSRYALENKNWKAAAEVQLLQKNFSWNDFPWQKAIVHFTRVMGAVHTGNAALANTSLRQLKDLQDTLLKQKDVYKAGQVAIQLSTAEAWMQFKAGQKETALTMMASAAEREDKTEKHPVTPGEVIPAKELLADMLLAADLNDRALAAYEESLKKHPNRFNSLSGAGLAAERSGNTEKAELYYRQLIRIAGQSGSVRKELQQAAQYLENDGSKKKVASR